MPLHVREHVGIGCGSGEAERLCAEVLRKRSGLLRRMHARNVRKLPKARKKAVLWALAERRSPIFRNEQQHRAVFSAARLLFCAHGQVLCRAVRPAEAKGCSRAAAAQWRAVGEADRCAKLHQRLCERAALPGRVSCGKRCAERPLRFRRVYTVSAIRKARGDAQHIAVDGGRGQIKADRSNRAGGILPDSGQRAQRGIAFGEVAAVFAHEDPGRALEVARAAIIAQAFPKFEQAFFLYGGKGGHIRKHGKEARVIAKHSRNARLLQHDFGNPNAVRLARFAPGKRPCGGSIPRQQERRKRPEWEGGEAAHTRSFCARMCAAASANPAPPGSEATYGGRCAMRAAKGAMFATAHASGKAENIGSSFGESPKKML